jgi:HD-GYP domain-containing protein (c-di-GMP phosphodiesterase class II)
MPWILSGTRIYDGESGMSLKEILGQSRFVRFTGDAEEVTRGYMRVSMKNLFRGSRLSYDVYFPVVGAGSHVVMHKLLGKGQTYDPQARKMLEGKGFEYFYVPESQKRAFEDYLMNNTKTRISSPHVTVAEMAELLYGNADYVLEKAFSGGQLQDAIPQGLSFAREAARQFSQNRIAVSELMKIFSKDYSTFTHSIQVCLLGMAFCIHLGYSDKEAADFGLGALFHDIGKSEIDDNILKKPSMLTTEEFEQVKRHALLGYEKLAKLNLLNHDQLSIVLHHHEDMNGDGYPSGLAGTAIHTYARIARIVDSYDALTTRRSYKDAFSPAEAFHVMEEEMKSALDEDILRRFWDFTKVEEHPVGIDQGVRLSIEVGNQVQIEFAGKSDRFNAKFIGMDPGAYLIIHLPSLADFKEQIFKGRGAVLRYICNGTVYGFETKIITYTLQPSRLLFLSYPEKITTCEIRRHARFDCFFFTRAAIGGETYRGIVSNISIGGCLFMTDQLSEKQAANVKLDDPVTLDFQVFDGKGVKDLPGEVRNVRRGENRVEIGVRFLKLSDNLKITLTDAMKGLAMASKPI